MATTDSRSITTRVLDWLRAGYPEGVPRKDYLPLLGVLRRSLTEEDISAIADDLVLATASGDDPISREEIAQMIQRTVIQSPSAEDIARVSARLAAGGWPLVSYAPHEAPSV